MIYIVIYLLGFILTCALLIMFDKEVDDDYMLYLIVAALWPVFIPVKIFYSIYYFIRDKIKEYKAREPYKDPWEEALREWDSQDIARIEARNRLHRNKNTKQFKFGR